MTETTASATAKADAERAKNASETVLKPREKSAAGKSLTSGEEAQVVDFKALSEQAEEDFLAQAQASARSVVSNRQPVPEPGLGSVDGDKNDAGQLVEPEVLAIQERQKQELADREAQADEDRSAQDQGPRTTANHPEK